MDMELKYLLMVINIKENIEKENSMGKVNIHGQTLLHLKVIFVKEWDMGMEHGDLLKLMEMFMLEHIKMIKKVDMVDMFGQMDAFMKETLLKMLSK